MKNLAQIVLVTVVQFIACYLAEWGVAETGIILLLSCCGRGCLSGYLFKFVKKITYLMSSSLVKEFGM